MLSIGEILKFFILLLNAGAILSEKRFLQKCMSMTTLVNNNTFHRNTVGLALSADMLSTEGNFKTEFIRMIDSVRRIARIPLIAANCLVIVMALVFG